MTKIEKAYKEKCFGRKLSELDSESRRILNTYLSYTSGLQIPQEWLEPVSDDSKNQSQDFK